MQQVTRATSIAAVAVVSIFMLMQKAAAVEVSPQQASTTFSSADPLGQAVPWQTNSGPNHSESAPSAPAPSPLTQAGPTIPALTSLGKTEQTDLGEAGLAPRPTSPRPTSPPPSSPPPSSPQCFILGSRSFSIPFSVDAAGAAPVEVHLFVSRGPDDPWRLLDRKSPKVASKQFQFEADQDGEFWFATRTIDALGRPHPAGPIESQLKVYVDTTKPHVTMLADADADGRVMVNLSIHDSTNVKEMRLRYVTDQLKQWVNVDLASLTAEGTLEFHPSDPWKQLSLQLIVSDTPGNQAMAHQLIRRPRLAEAEGNRYAAGLGRGSTEASAAPYRIDAGNPLPAQTVSNPIIKLDRHQPRPVSNVTTAQGYAPQPPSAASQPLYGFRGANASAASPSAGQVPPMTFAPPPALAPAPTQPSPQANTLRQHPVAAPPAGQPTATAPNWNASPGSLPAHGVVPSVDKVSPQFVVPPAETVHPSALAATSPAAPALSGGALPGGAPAATPEGPRGVDTPPGIASSTPTAPPAPLANGPEATRTPTSFFDHLFGNVPDRSSLPAAYPAAGGESTGYPPAAGFGPPSIREPQVQSRFAGNARPALPPPATPEQISHGFGLNSPEQTQPETIPVPDNPEPMPSRPRPKTPAEAMRPLSEPSEVSAFTPDEVANPGGQSDSYRSMRSTPDPGTASPAMPGLGIPDSPSAPSESGSPVGSVANMMQRAPVRFSDSERFSLEYELEAVGVQGVEAVELYGTTDGGRRWELWGRDPDRTTPFDIETREAGIFGFRIVVVGRNGLASPRPLAGEAADIVVVVDTIRPRVRITGAQYGQGDRIGSLVIRYECEDENLQPRPVSLSFSDRLEGPWTTIAAGLRNDGEYVWSADPNLPRAFYLRIDATDQAGNRGSYVLDQPIDAQGLAPRARIRGFQSVFGGELPESEGQTAKRPKALFK